MKAEKSFEKIEANLATERDIVFIGKDGERIVELAPTDKAGVYQITNPILTTKFVNLSEVYAAMGKVSAPIDWC